MTLICDISWYSATAKSSVNWHLIQQWAQQHSSLSISLDVFHGASLWASSRSRWNFILAHFAPCQVSEWHCVFLRQLRSCILYFTSHLAPDALMMIPPAPLKMFFFRSAWFSPQNPLTRMYKNEIWQNLAEFGRIWQNLAELGRIWQNLAEFDRIWQNLVEFGRIWRNLAEYGRIWQNLAEFGGDGGRRRRRRRRRKFPICVKA